MDLQQVCDKVSSQVELDAAKMTARTFSAAYMKKYGPAGTHGAGIRFQDSDLGLNALGPLVLGFRVSSCEI